MKTRRFQFLFSSFPVFVAGWISHPVIAEDSPEPLAILQRDCLRCHTEEKRKGGLLLTSREALLAGGDSGPAAANGQSGGSLFIETLFPDSDPHMPPKGQLSPAEIVALSDWIDEGLPWDEAHWKRLQRSAFEAPVNLTALPANYSPVFALALSPDGKTLAAGRANRVELFAITESEDGKSPPAPASSGILIPAQDTVEALAWSPDGGTLATGNFRRLTLWDAKSREKRAEITEGISGRISALSFSPDSRKLLVADSIDSVSGQLMAIDSSTGKISWSETAHPDAIFDIAVSPNGKLAATASADKTVKAWNLEDGKLRQTLEGHTGYVLTAAFSPDNLRLASAGDDEEIKVWRIETGKKIASFGGSRTGAITDLAWSTDPTKAKQKAEEKDKEKADAINTDRIVAINEAGRPRIYTDLNEHEGEQRSTGAREKAAEEVGRELAILSYDPLTHRFFAGSIDGALYRWSADGKIEFRQEQEKLAANQSTEDQ